MQTKYLCVLIHSTSFVETLCFFSVLCLLPLCSSVYMCHVVTCWERADLFWLSFLVSNCEFVTFPLVSWVKCGTGLHRFLIFAPLLTSIGMCVRFGPVLLANCGHTGHECFGY